MQKAQEELQNIIVHGESGGGMVKISITCKNEIKKIDIDDSLFSEERDMLEDLLIAAFNDAIRKADKKNSGKHVRHDIRTESPTRHEASILSSRCHILR